MFKLVVEYCVKYFSDIDINEFIASSIKNSANSLTRYFLNQIKTVDSFNFYKLDFAYVDQSNCNALYYCLINNNFDIFAMIFDKIEKFGDNNKYSNKSTSTTDYNNISEELINKRIYYGRNLIHVICEKDSNIKFLDLILERKIKVDFYCGGLKEKIPLFIVLENNCFQIFKYFPIL